MTRLYEHDNKTEESPNERLTPDATDVIQKP